VQPRGGLGGWGFYLHFLGPLLLPLVFLLPCCCLVRLATGWLCLVLAMGILFGVLCLAPSWLVGGWGCLSSFLRAMVVPFRSSPWLFMTYICDGSRASSCGYACYEDAHGTHGGVECRRGCSCFSLAPSFVIVSFAVAIGGQWWCVG
jgi:hypothetical protein